MSDSSNGIIGAPVPGADTAAPSAPAPAGPDRDMSDAAVAARMFNHPSSVALREQQDIAEGRKPATEQTPQAQQQGQQTEHEAPPGRQSRPPHWTRWSISTGPTVKPV